MAKEIKIKMKIVLPAGRATLAPPVGPALSPTGINTNDFITQFNDKTKEGNGILTPAILTIYEDRSFDFVLKTPPVSELIRRELKINSGSPTPNLKKVGKLTLEQIDAIAEIKKVDLNTDDISQIRKIIGGTAMQMGIDVPAEAKK